jgi:hypothetical protein
MVKAGPSSILWACRRSVRLTLERPRSVPPHVASLGMVCTSLGKAFGPNVDELIQVLEALRMLNGKAVE